MQLSVEEALSTLGRAALSVMLAELGDKTMLATAALAALQKPLLILALSGAAYLAANALPVVLASSLYSALGGTPLPRIAAGALFVALGVYMLRSEERELRCDSLGAAFAAVFLAELGDKTQLASIAVALTTGSPLPALLGGLAGYMAANAVGVVVSGRVSRKLGARRVAYLASAVFVAVGALTVASALLFP